MYVCAELYMPTVHYPESGTQLSRKIIVFSLILQIKDSSNRGVVGIQILQSDLKQLQQYIAEHYM